MRLPVDIVHTLKKSQFFKLFQRFQKSQGLQRFQKFQQSRCFLCMEPFSPLAGIQKAVCIPCSKLLIHQKTGFCPFCGDALLNENDTYHCSACAVNPPPWHNFRFYAFFDDEVRTIIHDAKYSENSCAWNIAGEMLKEACHDLNKPNYLIPLPLHTKRLRQRGFNQSLEIAKPLAQSWNMLPNNNILFKVRETTPQIELNESKREKNIKNAFAINTNVDISGAHILLIDDVATTTSTLREAAKVLLKAGVARLDVAVIARTKKI